MKKLFRLIYPFLIYTLLSSAIIESAYIIYNLLSPEKAINMVNRQIVYLTALSAVMAGMLLLLFYRRDCRLRGEDLGRIYRVPRGILYAAALGMSASLFDNHLLSLLRIQALFPAYDETEAVLFGISLPGQLLCLGICIPFAEEMVFRVLGFRRLRDDCGFLPSLFISSLLFGIYHGNMVQFIYAALLGGIIAYAYELYDSVWIPVVIHGAANIMSVLMSAVPPYGFLESPPVMAVGVLAALAVMAQCFKKIRYMGKVNL